MLRRTRLLPLALLVLMAATGLRADAPAFDLAGPKIDLHVQRNGKTLPIAEVPNLLPGDRLWIHPDLPPTQSAHYILIVTFLRGATNPPPNDWFHRVETWKDAVRQEGVFVVVPPEAEQALFFLAPETTGDFTTLRKAVHDRPGAFVRATQDLQQASWDRLRLDDYLAQIKVASSADPKELKEKTALAARSLGMRVEQQCFDKPSEQQAPCLVQHTEGLVLDDSNAQSVVTQMASGSGADMMNQLSYAGTFGAGAFSPYVGAVVDLARILSTIHTAKYQYIPALALPQRNQQDTLNLRLNVPPSFRDPKSVIVVALPPIGPSHPPDLRPPDVAQNTVQNYCATKPQLALLAEGGPLVFASALAHDLTLHVDTKAPQPAIPGQHPELTIQPPPSPSAEADTKPGGAVPAPVNSSANQPSKGIDIPIHPAPLEGGFVLDAPLPLIPEDEVVGQIRGQWGFDELTGPKFHLQSPHPGGWTIAPGDQNALITGREDTLHLQGPGTLCVEDVMAAIPEHGRHTEEVKLQWKSPKPDQMEVAVPLKEAPPGTVTIAIHQYGLNKAEELPLKAYAEAASLEHISLSAGDKVALLKGKRLDEVESADLAGITFAPAALNRVQDYDQLELAATGVTSTLQPGDSYLAKVTLRDGRTLHVPATVTRARPQVELLSKGVQQNEADAGGTADAGAPLPIRLGSPDDLPLQRRIVFFLKTEVPATFSRSEKVEIASTEDGADGGGFSTTLSFADGGLMLEDTHTAVATIDPLAKFGPSAFGPIHLRAISSDGVAGDWVPLGTLVRLPVFPSANALRCPRSAAKPCTLTGNNLFLITAVGSSAEMANAVDVPPQFTGNTMAVPNTAHANPPGTLYVRLRDDPGTVQALNLPVTAWGTAPEPAPAPNASTTAANVAAPKPDPGTATDSASPTPH